MTKIYKGFSEEEIQEKEKRIYEKYPPTKKEISGCSIEKARMEGLRNEFRKRLVEMGKEKREFK